MNISQLDNATIAQIYAASRCTIGKAELHLAALPEVDSEQLLLSCLLARVVPPMAKLLFDSTDEAIHAMSEHFSTRDSVKLRVSARTDSAVNGLLMIKSHVDSAQFVNPFTFGV